MKLEIRGLCVTVENKKVLDGISLVVNPGEIHAIMGPNGTGKSTLSNVIAGHPRYRVESGDILVDNKSILKLSASERARLGIFLSFQHPVEVEGVCVSKFLFAAAKTRDSSLSFVSFKRELDALSKQFNFDKSFLERDLNVGFSGGEKKRIEVLQMALLKPKLALLDELDSGVDIDSLKLIGRTLDSMRGSDFSALVITHYNRLLDFVCPSFVHVLSGGKIVASGPAALARDIESKGYAPIVAK